MPGAIPPPGSQPPIDPSRPPADSGQGPDNVGNYQALAEHMHDLAEGIGMTVSGSSMPISQEACQQTQNRLENEMFPRADLPEEPCTSERYETFKQGRLDFQVQQAAGRSSVSNEEIALLVNVPRAIAASIVGDQIGRPLSKSDFAALAESSERSYEHHPQGQSIDSALGIFRDMRQDRS